MRPHTIQLQLPSPPRLKIVSIIVIGPTYQLCEIATFAENMIYSEKGVFPRCSIHKEYQDET
jgi:hypothetical protein